MKALVAFILGVSFRAKGRLGEEESQEGEQACDSDQGEKSADGEARRPGEPVEWTAVHHGDGNVCGIVQHRNKRADAGIRRRAFPFFETNGAVVCEELDERKIDGTSVA